MLPAVEEIRSRRKKLGLTQSMLSGLTSISRTSISKLENGEVDLGYSKVKRIFDVLEEIGRDRDSFGGFEEVVLGRIHSTPVAGVDSSDLVHSVWAVMVESDFSQLVVREGERIVGSISERAINRAIRDRGVKAGGLKVSEIMMDSFPMVGVDAPVSTVIPLLMHYQAVLTIRDGEVVGIVTNSDIGRIFSF